MFNPRNILVATDFSDESREALAEALDIAERYGSTVHLLHVIQDIQQCTVDFCLSDGEIIAERNRLRDEAMKKLINEINFTRNMRDIPIRKEISFGNVVDEIVRYEMENGIDLVVTAPHRSRKRWRIMPHLTETLVEKSRCEAMVVR